MNFDIETIKRKMLIKYPFFGSVVANVDYKIDTNIPTAETDGEVVYYNPKFLEKISIEEQTFTFAHEICHIAFNHILRSEGKDSDIWNIATDAVINAFLKRDGLKLIEGVVDMADAINYDAEQLYEKLLQEKQQKSQGSQSKKQNKQQGEQGKSQQNQSGQGNSGQQSQQEQSQDLQFQNSQGQSQNSEIKSGQGNISRNENSNSPTSEEKEKQQQSQGSQSKKQNKQQGEQGKLQQNQSGQGDFRQQNQQDKSQDSQSQNQEQSQNSETKSGQKNMKENENSNSSTNEKQQSDGNSLSDSKSQENKNDNSSKNGDLSSQGEKQDVGHNTHSMWADAVKKHKEEQKRKENLSDKIFNNDKQEKNNQQNEIEKKQEETTQLGEKETFKKNLEEKKKELEKLKKILSEQAMGQGSTTNRDIRNITDIGRAKPLIDWRYVLREAIKYDVDWSYKNATIEDGVISANLEEQPMPETEIVLDTSGSINETLLKNFLRECKNILQHSKLKVGCFDTKFYGFHEIRTEEDIENMKFVGNGGTDFNVAVSAFSRRVENKIIFTDGDASMPNMPLDAIWIVFGGIQINPKGGKVIQINSEQLDKLYSYQQDSSYKGRNK